MTNGFTATEAITIYSDVQMGLGTNAKTLAYWISAYLVNRVANEGPGSEAYLTIQSHFLVEHDITITDAQIDTIIGG